MDYTAPTVNYSATINGTYTSLTGIQTVSISRGRQRFQDNFTQTNCTIELIPATTYALPLAVGQFIDVRNTNTSTSPAYFVGVITDIERKYAMPYNSVSSYAPADRITITCAGSTGALGNATLSNYSLPASLASYEIFVLAAANNIFDVETASFVKNSAQTFSGGALDLVNTLLRTAQLIVDDVDTQRATTDFGFTRALTAFPAGQGNRVYTFSDAGTVGAYKYSDLQYLSSVQNYFTQVQVTAAGLATQTASSGSAPYNTLVYDTYNASTSDASSLASFILTTQSFATITPYSIATNTNLTATCTTVSQLSNLTDLVGSNKAVNIGSSVTVIFRGTTVTATIQGINTTFYPDYATVQLFLSPSLGTAFTLDSTVLGVLDTNRLGYP